MRKYKYVEGQHSDETFQYASRSVPCIGSRFMVNIVYSVVSLKSQEYVAAILGETSGYFLYLGENLTL